MFNQLIPWKTKEPSNLPTHGEHPVALFRDEYEELWNRFRNEWNTELTRWNDWGWRDSRVDFDEEENRYVFRAELPGFEPEDFDVKVSGNVLSLHAEREVESRERDSLYHQRKSFCESFALPEGVDVDQIDAQYHSGVLEVYLPKNRECQTKRIDVKSA